VTRRILSAVLVILVGVGAASCAGEDEIGSASHRMTEWVKGTGLGEDIGTLVADNTRLPKVIPNGTPAVHGACGTMLDDAEMANGELPSPDAQVTDWLSTAYGLEGTAANQCYNAGSTNPTLLAKAEKEMAHAQALYSRALIRIESRGGGGAGGAPRAPKTP
jgi:hypothetical protein